MGLPNVGKSTLFNAMTSAGAAASNFPFCTIEPNVGMAVVRDSRLDRLAEIFSPEKVTPAVVRFVDIAGLVKDAHKGEGLGNQFLANIREVDAICHVVRCFSNENVVHVHGDVNPLRDVELIETELILADLQTVDRRLEKVARVARTDKTKRSEEAFLREVRETLERGEPARAISVREETAPLFRELSLLTAKPVLFAANVGEKDLGNEDSLDVVKRLRDRGEVVVVSAEVEAEIAAMPEEERGEFLEAMGLKESGLDRLVKAAYRLLGLETYLTGGEKEVRAWPFRKGTKAPQAAGIIHSDFEKHFIRAEVVAFEDLDRCGSMLAAREAGRVRLEGKDYVMRDGDVVHFRVGV